jgi:hypothetical protein
MFASITSGGKNLIKNAPPTPQDALVQSISRLPESGRKALARNLATIAGDLGGAGPEPMLFEDSPK